MPVHPLEMIYRDAVHSSLIENLGLQDHEIVHYLTQMLCGFSEAENLYKLRNHLGQPIQELEEMLWAADPVFGTAPSFEAEREARRKIGDYALFVAGMFPEATLHGPYSQPSLGELIHIGKESYWIVSLFNQGEHARDAKLYARLSESFERCVLGLALVRDQLTPDQMLPRPACVR
jgi:hypothetical protein